jgi:hypothetical protein
LPPHTEYLSLAWAERLKCVFDVDISVYPLCGGTLRVISDITDPDSIQPILEHLKQRANRGYRLDGHRRRVLRRTSLPLPERCMLGKLALAHRYTWFAIV